ncbi:CAAX prenyl protease 1 homolog [Daktulosphaira vitifoliae]|uniref:CAAX prenyl protease 1 homolog n=1 Tax=Daktulosphaira vitifoliae TaxID=58002 RepID=UPI0021A9BE0B|nr:CAAX prenyl protease 1 homolog [Daktulosphaira vitifoliae]
MIPEFCVFYGVLTFSWIEFLWEQYLTLRQRRVYKTTNSIPEKLVNVLDVETFNKAKSYGLDKNTFNIYEEWFNMIISTGFICFNGFTLIWNLSKSCLASTKYEDSEIMISCIFLLFMNTMGTLISFPISIYNTFVIEEKHGFNKQTASFFIKDKIKNFLLIQVIALPITAAAITIVKWGGRYFFIWLWVFAVVTSLFIMTIYPEFIAPLFDKYTALTDGPLKTKIEELAKQVNFPLYKIYIVEGSKRSAHSNAYFYGFFNSKRIVLYDTLLKNDEELSEKKEDNESKTTPTEDSDSKKDKGKGMNDEEILAVLGHELGHWKLNHILCYIIISQVNLFVMLFVFGWLYDHSMLYRAFGFYETTHPVIIGLAIIFQYVFSPYNTVISFAMTTLSRKLEFQADAFAKKLGKAKPLESGLIRLNNDNLGFPVYDSLYSSWHHTHPQLLERLEAISKTD